MEPHINTDHDQAPSELRRSIEEFWPDAVEVRVAGVTESRVVMAVGTAELRKSGYDNPKVDYQWLYFRPEGARKFAELLTRMAEYAENGQSGD